MKQLHVFYRVSNCIHVTKYGNLFGLKVLLMSLRSSESASNNCKIGLKLHEIKSRSAVYLPSDIEQYLFNLGLFWSAVFLVLNFIVVPRLILDYREYWFQSRIHFG